MRYDIVKKLLKDYEPKHSKFQIKNFIIRGQGDEWFQYKQCLREISARVESIENAKDQLDLFKINRRGIMRKIKIIVMGRQRREIFLKSELRQSAGMAENIEETERELKQFVELAVGLKKRIGDIDDEKRQKLEAQSWYDKASKMAAVDIMTIGALSRQTFEFIFSLPEKQQENIFASIKLARPERKLSIGRTS